MRTSRRRNPRRFAAGAAAAATAFAVLSAIPSPATASPATAIPAAVPTPFSATVTLITGDTVSVSTLDGKTSVDATPAPGNTAPFQTLTAPDGDVYVYPRAALAGVGSGVLDAELFNVTAIAAAGYDDASRGTLPVIVEYSGGSVATLAERAESLPASGGALPLSALNAAGLSVDKATTAEFFASLGTGGGRRTLAARTVGKVWLDTRVEVALEDSVPQIGAPGAWAAGHDGTGVKVAVLDTGADATHPDLAGRIALSESFVPGEETTDGQGHGTHVAATIAGSGDGSQGLRKGVAPGAELLVGKVLDNGGSGQASWIIAGMEWAAQQGADVISMSLGGDTSTPDDIMSDAVDTLTTEYGSLFVIAAGNSGPRGTTIGSPGTADSALTVGAVDKSDGLASFSSRGPRVGDNGLKPEITAPGVGIIAARAKGTSLGTPVDEYYSSLNGTSMATPHVAGAAAIMKQLHPGLTPAQLKNALVSTAKNHAGYTVYEQGAGRVDLTAGTAASVFASATADFGTLTPKEGGTPPVTRTVTYTNIGTADAVLDLALALDRDTIPGAGEVSLSANTLTVPAGGSADVTITVDPMTGALGAHDGYLTATGADVSLTTSVGYVRKPPEVEISLKGIDRFGDAPAILTVQVFDLATGGTVYTSGSVGVGLGTGDTYVASVPKGRYAVQAVLNTLEIASWTDVAVDYYSAPEVVVDAPVSLTMDARDAVDIETGVSGEKRDLDLSWTATAVVRDRGDGSVAIGSFGVLSDDDVVEGVVRGPGRAETGSIQFFNDRGFADPLLTGKVAGRGGERLDLQIPLLGTRTDGKRKLTAVAVGDGSEEAYAGKDVKDRLAVVTASTGWVGPLMTLAAAKGAAAVLFVRPDAGPSFIYTGPGIPAMAATYESGRALLARMAKGTVTVELATRSESRFTYLVPAAWVGDSLPARPEYTAPKRKFAVVENSYHSDGSSRLAWEHTGSWHSFQRTSYRTAAYLLAPSVREEYVYAPDMTYQQTVYSGQPGIRMYGGMNSYRPGERHEQDWFGGPVHPGVSPVPCGFCRTDTAWAFAVTPWGDSDPSHYGDMGVAAAAGRIFRNGVLVTDGEVMTPGTADYRVEYDMTRAQGPGSTHGTSTSTAWSFRSADPSGVESAECERFAPGVDCGVLPIILTGYDLPLDLHNQARAGRDLEFDLLTSRATGYTGDARISGATVSVSYDDGATWTEAEVDLGRRGSHEVEVEHPRLSATNGFVALRIEVWDDAGNRTVQTILRAYALI
ncbi:S8 family serine peptidase [Phytomonospora sp. NPDC050363]|uniref:S8 family peptidase n=1 Tax=Phytomonospora sp. NPDC050363 TaxID=3155642 RepID=UPI0033FDB694